MIGQLIAIIRQTLETGNPPAANWTYDLGPDGKIFIDCASPPYQVTREDRNGQCVISTRLETLLQMLQHKTDSVTVFTQGGLRLAGDMQLVRKLDILFGTHRPVQG